ncbi:zinc dependent phospholipase C family protein [Paenibacillus sp. TRM 82003]|nr:zinc dependent phospholipase C family protein [Paenibacillus sp. TRM 82003]
MPNVWTHSIYGELLLDRLGLRGWTTVDPAAGALFRFGCQGPDPLFYHRFYPWMKTASAASDRLGGVLHKRRCGPFLRAMLQSCAGAEPTDPRVVYALGWLAHHTLDRVAHPYVFARQGNRRRDHQRLEVALDTIVAEHLRRIDTARVPLAPTLDAGARLPDGVATLVENAIRATYPELGDTPPIEGLWQRSYRDMLTALRLFHDPRGVKRVLTAGAIEPFAPGRRRDPDDAANDARTPWTPPAEPEKTSRETFWDVWESALADGERVLGAAAAWVIAANAARPADSEKQTAAWNAFHEALGDRSYETGLAADR